MNRFPLDQNLKMTWLECGLAKKGFWKEHTEVSSHPTTVEPKLSDNQRGKLDIQALCLTGVKHGLLVWL